MPDIFPVFQVVRSMMIGPEQVGSKPKFWLQLDGRKGLYKAARAGTGEHWVRAPGESEQSFRSKVNADSGAI